MDQLFVLTSIGGILLCFIVWVAAKAEQRRELTDRGQFDALCTRIKEVETELRLLRTSLKQAGA